MEKQLDTAAPGGRDLGVFEVTDHDTDVTLRVNLVRAILHAVATQAANEK
jgi:hypothetical protein